MGKCIFMSELDSASAPLTRTSWEHYERVLQHLVSYVSVSVSFFMISTLLLAQTELAKCSGEREVWQLRQISVVLQCRNKQCKGNIHTVACTLTCTSQSWYSWRSKWYSLDRSTRKSMSRSMHSGSESGSKLKKSSKTANQILFFLSLHQPAPYTIHKMIPIKNKNILLIVKRHFSITLIYANVPDFH